MTLNRFPDPILPGASFQKQRQFRRKHVISAARRGMILRTAVVIIEIFGFWSFDSASLLLDALGSLLDVASTLFLMLCIQAAARPPDKNHPFGHGRYEPLGGLQLGLLLVIIGSALFVQQGYSAWIEVPLKHIVDSRAWMIALVSVVILELAYHLTSRVAKQEGSTALKVEAWHYRADAMSSAVATIALAFAALAPKWGAIFDHLGAMSIAALMGYVGWQAIHDNLRQLTDHTPNEELFSRVRTSAMRVPGVYGTEKVRIQRYGPDAHVDIDIEVDPKLPVDQAHRISQKVRAHIQADWPQVQDVTVHIEPYYVDDH